MIHIVPARAFEKPNPDMVMLFTPFGCTHSPPSISPFLLTQNLFIKDISRSDIMKLKVS